MFNACTRLEGGNVEMNFFKIRPHINPDKIQTSHEGLYQMHDNG